MLFEKFVAKVYRDLKAMHFHKIRICKFDWIYRDFIETSIEIGMKTNLIENYSIICRLAILVFQWELSHQSSPSFPEIGVNEYLGSVDLFICKSPREVEPFLFYKGSGMEEQFRVLRLFCRSSILITNTRKLVSNRFQSRMRLCCERKQAQHCFDLQLVYLRSRRSFN